MRSMLKGFFTLCMLSPMSIYGQQPAMVQTSPIVRPAVELILKPASATAVPSRRGVSYANGGVIDVTRPDPFTIVVVMSGLVATNADLCSQSVANYQFDLTQDFEVVFHSNQVKSAKLTLEAQVAGLLRTNHGSTAGRLSQRGGTAEMSSAHASLSSGPHEIVAIGIPGKCADACQELSIFNHEGPIGAEIQSGQFTLHQSFGIGSTHPALNARGASAQFSPQPFDSPDVYGFRSFRPFTGAATKNFGYQVTIKVVPDGAKAKE